MWQKKQLNEVKSIISKTIRIPKIELKTNSLYRNTVKKNILIVGGKKSIQYFLKNKRNNFKKANFIFSTFGKAFNAATNIEEYLLSAVCLKLHQSFSWSLYKDKT